VERRTETDILLVLCLNINCLLFWGTISYICHSRFVCYSNEFDMNVFSFLFYSSFAYSRIKEVRIETISMTPVAFLISWLFYLSFRFPSPVLFMQFTILSIFVFLPLFSQVASLPSPILHVIFHSDMTLNKGFNCIWKSWSFTAPLFASTYYNQGLKWDYHAVILWCDFVITTLWLQRKFRNCPLIRDNHTSYHKSQMWLSRLWWYWMKKNVIFEILIITSLRCLPCISS
jgi:hypothetical protein